MLELDVILTALKKDEYSKIVIKSDEDYDFNVRNSCFILKKGDLLSYGEKNFTHKLEINDPIRIAETIYSRDNLLVYKKRSDITLIKFDGKKMREEVNQSSALVKSIIKYSLNRIFSLGSSKVPYYFEDDFLHKFNAQLKRLNIERGEFLFSHGDSARRMYFIEKGAIKLSQESGNEIAVLGKGECFGESAILQGTTRSLSAETIEDTKLRIIGTDLIESEILEQTGLVQIAAFGILRRLHFMNILRNPSKQNSDKE